MADESKLPERTPGETSSAWQPFSPGGVAAFGSGRLGRLLAAQFIAAAVSGAVLGWFIFTAWFPIIATAVDRLPNEGRVAAGSLYWPGAPMAVLSESKFLGIAVNTEFEPNQQVAGDCILVFGARGFRTGSIAGHTFWSYPRRSSFPANRPELQPLWGAWSLWLGLVFCGGASLALIVTWWVLAALYTPPLVLWARVMRRRPGVWRIWKAACAAQLTGAAVLLSGIVAYRLRWLDVLQLLGFFVAHFLFSWLYASMAVLHLRRRKSVRSASGENPFATARPE